MGAQAASPWTMHSVSPLCKCRACHHHHHLRLQQQHRRQGRGTMATGHQMAPCPCSTPTALTMEGRLHSHPVAALSSCRIATQGRMGGRHCPLFD